MPSYGVRARAYRGRVERDGTRSNACTSDYGNKRPTGVCRSEDELRVQLCGSRSNAFHAFRWLRTRPMRRSVRRPPRRTKDARSVERDGARSNATHVPLRTREAHAQGPGGTVWNAFRCNVSPTMIDPCARGGIPDETSPRVQCYGTRSNRLVAKAYSNTSPATGIGPTATRPAYNGMARASIAFHRVPRGPHRAYHAAIGQQR